MKRCAVVFNHSITTFEKTAKKLVAALKKEGFDAFSESESQELLQKARTHTPAAKLRGQDE